MPRLNIKILLLFVFAMAAPSALGSDPGATLVKSASSTAGGEAQAPRILGDADKDEDMTELEEDEIEISEEDEIESSEDEFVPFLPTSNADEGWTESEDAMNEGAEDGAEGHDGGNLRRRLAKFSGYHKRTVKDHHTGHSNVCTKCSTHDMCHAAHEKKAALDSFEDYAENELQQGLWCKIKKIDIISTLGWERRCANCRRGCDCSCTCEVRCQYKIDCN